MQKLYYSIGEVSELIDEEQHILRHWEKTFQVLKPKKNSSGVRVYNSKDIEALKAIKMLLREKLLSTKDAKALLKSRKDVISIITPDVAQNDATKPDTNIADASDKSTVSPVSSVSIKETPNSPDESKTNQPVESNYNNNIHLDGIVSQNHELARNPKDAKIYEQSEQMASPAALQAETQQPQNTSNTHKKDPDHKAQPSTPHPVTPNYNNNHHLSSQSSPNQDAAENAKDAKIYEQSEQIPLPNSQSPTIKDPQNGQTTHFENSSNSTPKHLTDSAQNELLKIKSVLQDIRQELINIAEVQ